MTNLDTGFSAEALARVLTASLAVTRGACLRVAYSGGLDSHVLLHAACALRAAERWRVSAVHIDHGLQPPSPLWARHCAQVCEGLGVACRIERVEVANVRDHGLEAAARRARYERLAHILEPGEILLTAHHLDDQAETVLLQLLRGAGVHGIAAMPACTDFGPGRLLRPLLDFTRADLAAYGAAYRLRWIEDASNRDLRQARNFLRHRVLPEMRSRWPAAVRAIARSARHAADAAELVDEIAAVDEQGCRDREGAISTAALARLAPPRARNMVRYWLRRGGFRAPSAAVLEQILAQTRSRTRGALVRWSGGEVRRYRDALTVATVTPAPRVELDRPWDPPAPLDLAELGLRLRAVPQTGQGLSVARLAGRRLRVRLRRGGEVCRLPGRAHRHRLKTLLQEAGVPPWERRRLVLVYAEGELAAIGERWVCEPFAARPDEPAWRLTLEPLEK